jgi:hypothetical protein
LSLYDKKELEQWLKPRLERATVLGPLQQTVWQWHNKRRVFIAAVVGIALMLAVVIAVEGDWAKDWADQWVQSQPECQVEG